jgi:murein L,D-transpeptidase YcbB/YkuD
MVKRFISLAALLLCAAASAAPDPEIHWTQEQIEQLRDWLRLAPQEGLVLPVAPELAAEVATGDSARIERAMTSLALTLARAYLFGSSGPGARAGWRIGENDAAIDLSVRLSAALARNDVDGFYTALRPRNTDYEALRTALSNETDPKRRTVLIRNLERWRWLPLDMGHRYLLVNAAGFEVGLWEEGHRVARWRVITGKPRTPTPVFSALVTGVTLNPWWEIPPSIVRENGGRFSSSRGYVLSGGRWRQRPGPGNSLGLMKLAMPNPYNVYLHDTPTKALFDKPVRAFSHGCVRVDKPLTLAARLLGRSIDAEVARGATVTLPLGDPLPVYVAYFTADVSEAGAVEFHGDIYGRDARMGGSHIPVPVDTD